MKKRLILVVCLSVILCSCGQQTEIQNIEATKQENADEEKQQEEPEYLVEETEEQEPEQQGPEEEDQYAIYERFMAGDEPLYFREDLWGWDQYPDGGETAMLEACSLYKLDEICNRINRYDNSGRAVNEMEQLSYAYIDCGADGEIELALRFGGLVNMFDDNGSEVYIIKNISGRLEMCYGLDEMYRSWEELSNEYGVIVSGGSGGARYSSETVGFLDALGTYTQLYEKEIEYWGYGEDVFFDEYYEPELYHAVAGHDLEYLFAVTGYLFEPYDNNQDYDEYRFGIKYSFELYDRGDTLDTLVEDIAPSVYEDSVYQEILDAAGVPFYSAVEIDDMIADRAAQIGLTEEIMSGKPVEWIPFGEEDYNLLYGVEKEDGVSADESITMYWCDYSDPDTDLTLHYYYEDCNMWERLPVYEMNEISDLRDEAERALQGYKPFLFYDVTQENIDKYVVEDYLSAGMEDYDKEDVIDDKNAFSELYDSVQNMNSHQMIFGPNFVSDELGAVNYSYNLEYLFQLGYY